MKAEGKSPRGMIADALAVRFPHLTKDQRQRASEIILEKIAEATKEGRRLWFYEELPDGSHEISALLLEEVVRLVTKL